MFQAQNIWKISYLPPPRKGFLFGLEFSIDDTVEEPDSTSCCWQKQKVTQNLLNMNLS